MSINELLSAMLDSEAGVPFLAVVFVVIVITALVISRKAKDTVYEEEESTEIKVARNVKVISRRIVLHPINQSVVTNMVVFELANGQRMELSIKAAQIQGGLVEGDCGVLKYQGKRFVSFERM